MLSPGLLLLATRFEAAVCCGAGHLSIAPRARIPAELPKGRVSLVVNSDSIPKQDRQEDQSLKKKFMVCLSLYNAISFLLYFSFISYSGIKEDRSEEEDLQVDCGAGCGPEASPQ